MPAANVPWSVLEGRIYDMLITRGKGKTRVSGNESFVRPMNSEAVSVIRSYI